MSDPLKVRTRAVIIGVSRYESGFSQLPAVESDVKEMKKILESDPSDFEASEVFMLTEQKASRLEIIETLQTVLFGGRSRRIDFFVFSRTWHGRQQPRILLRSF